MAKKGEGDPRWIVQDRVDGKNVNGWHWTESDWTSWAKNAFQTEFKEYTQDSDKANWSITDIDVKGEVSVNTRKKKMILFYELDVTLKWKGNMKSNAEKEIKGSIHIPYISEENDDDDFEVRVSTLDEFSKDKDASNLQDIVRTQSIAMLKKRIPELLIKMRAESLEKSTNSLGSNIALKDAKKLPDLAPQTPSTTTNANNNSTTTTAAAAPKKEIDPKTLVKDRVTLELKHTFKCGPTDLFSCFIDPYRAKAFGGDQAVVSDQPKAPFSLFGGHVSGENIEVVFPKKLVQKWRLATWPAGFYSTATLDFSEKDGDTVLTIKQEDVPYAEREHTEEGWLKNYFARIKGVFGFGAVVF